MKPLYLLIPLILIMAACRTTPPPPPDYLNESPEAFEARMDWWRDATFGMFIHWGLYAVPAGYYNGEPVPGIGEWIMDRAQIPVEEYEKFATQFNPVQFNAEEWVRIAKDAGMKYIVITSKHHDGFCLWDSQVTDYDIVDATPYGRDLLAQLRDACEAAGIKLCFYHSIMDWHHPDAQAPHYPNYNTKEKLNPAFPNYYENYLKPQVAELITNYHPYVMWYDGEWIPEFTHEMGLEFYNFNRSLKPDLIVNNRVDKGRRGMKGINKDDQRYAGDFGTPEQEILESAAAFDWESCMTMNNTWGYKKDDQDWKSAATLIHNLADIAAKGGNYLLNVGPTAEGLIPQPSVERLAEMGAWLRVNGEAVYATNKGDPYSEGDSIRYTRSKDGRFIYAIALAWPGETLELTQVIPQSGSDIFMLGYDQPLDWSTDGNTLRIAMPALLQEPGARPCDYAWIFKIPVPN
ncbi:MAG TPA: alpha-L-fucosidase [Oceanipulchritudo sp.]|nr:alpha-L-fucosidase [Oceanipulchritudo sp.]